MSLTVKAYYEKSPDNTEIRRFAVDTNVSSNFNYLCSRITQVFGALTGKSYEVYWKDSDGDLVAFSTDEELVDALGFVNDAVFRVFIREKVQPVTPKNEGVPHPGIVCDGCNQNVLGTRYKCLECPDFDLCSVCESRGGHAMHKMLRLTDPNMSVHDLGGLFGPPPPPPGGPWHHHGPHGHHMGPHGPWQGPPHRGPPFGPWRKWMKKCWKQWVRNTNMQRQQQSDATSQAAGGDPMFCDDSETKQSSEGGACGGQQQQQQQRTRDQDDDSETSSAYDVREDYLKNVGESVAAMLDPLGISVDVDVEHNGARRRCGGQGQQGQTQGQGGHGRGWDQWKPWEAMFRNWGAGRGQTNPWSGCQQQQREEQKRREAATPTASEPSENEKPKSPETPAQPPAAADDADVQMGSPRLSESPPNEWTVLNKDASTSKSVAPPSAPAAAPQPTNAPPQQLYPLAQPPVHPNPQIREALAQLTQMGFSNDGGWLTSLLESKGGDINKVLDALKPHKA